MKHASGYYLNTYGRGVDVFVIFNEANDEPTEKELGIICDIVENALNVELDNHVNLTMICKTIQARIEDTNLNCVQASVQVIAQLL